MASQFRENQINAAMPTLSKYDVDGLYTWNKPDGLRYVKVEVLGAGGAGGGAENPPDTEASCGTGGGAGGYVVVIIDADDLPSSVSVTVGAGGTGVNGAPGNDGGDSAFGTFVTATGGSGGVDIFFSDRYGGTAGASGGSSSFTLGSGIAGFGMRGSPGYRGQVEILASNPSIGNVVAHAGAGGDSPYGAGGNGPHTGGATPSALDGGDAQGNGAGGGGGASAELQLSGPQKGSAIGGNGAPGMVLVWEYYI